MTKRFAISWVAGLVLAIVAQNPQAAAQMTLGTVTVQGSQSCGSRGFDSGMTCHAATLKGCPGNDDLQFVYGVETPSGTLKGTIVFFSGDGGDRAADGSRVVGEPARPGPDQSGQHGLPAGTERPEERQLRRLWHRRRLAANRAPATAAGVGEQLLFVFHLELHVDHDDHGAERSGLATNAGGRPSGAVGRTFAVRVLILGERRGVEQSGSSSGS